MFYRVYCACVWLYPRCVSDQLPCRIHDFVTVGSEMEPNVMNNHPIIPKATRHLQQNLSHMQVKRYYGLETIPQTNFGCNDKCPAIEIWTS